MNRLGIFVFYDKDGIVDDYVVYLLKNMESYLDKLLIVCNGKLTDEGRERLSNFSDHIYVRENTGYDAMAYKLAMTEYLGWNEAAKYDELLLFNDTFFGPLYPFSEMFDKMAESTCDFWGITYHAESYDYLCGTNDIIPIYLYTYFMLFRKPVFESSAFQDYWNRFDSTQWYFSDVARHEQFFTRYLEDAGFVWDAYVDTSRYNSTDPSSNFNPYYYIAYDLIRYHRCPLIKRKNFAFKHMKMHAGNTGEDMANAMRYIEQHTDYDTNMIWDNILRLYNITKIKDSLHLDHVLPWHTAYASVSSSILAQTAVIAYLQDEQAFPSCMDYFRQIPEGIELYLAMSNEHIAKQAQDACLCQNQQHWHIIRIPDEGQDVSALWIECRDMIQKYKYLCFVHDKRMQLSTGPATIGKSYFYNMWENTLKSTEYIENVITLFEQHSRLGFLSPPQPIHADFFGFIGSEWHDDYENTVELANLLGIHVHFSPDIPCFAFGNIFWCRTKALKPLYSHGFTYKELLEGKNSSNNAFCRAIERIYPYAAQSEGYYSGIVMNTDYASLQNTNLYYYLSGMLNQVRTKYGITDFDSVFQQDILSYCKGKQNIFVYGAGTNGIAVSNNLKNNNTLIKGFIVSDDQPKQEEKNGFPIFRLSEVPYKKEDMCIIVSVGYARDRIEVLSNLSRKGYHDFYLLP